MTKILCGDTSFEIVLSNNEEMQINLVGKPDTSLSFCAFLMNESGPTMVFYAPQMIISRAGSHENPSAGRWPDGTYLTKTKMTIEKDQFANEVCFKMINGCSEIAVEGELRSTLAKQDAFRNAEYREPTYLGGNRIKLHVLLDKCLLDYQQVFRGGIIQPLEFRLMPDSVVSAINRLLPKGIAFTKTETLDRAYGAEHPLSLVSFNNVCANNLAQAVETVNRPLLRIIGALGQNRDATPQILAYLKETDDNIFEMVTPADIYRGNLVSGFGAGVTPLLDRVAISGERVPWLDFLLNLMTSVRQQKNPEVMLFLAWSLIESASKRCIAKGTKVVRDENGVAFMSRARELTTATDLGRVIVYLRDHIGVGTLGLHSDKNTDFYSQIKLAYQCRNAVAHEGGIFRPGSAVPDGYTNDFPFSVRDWASSVVNHECCLSNA
jgi:hypothetical protein